MPAVPVKQNRVCSFRQLHLQAYFELARAVPCGGGVIRRGQHVRDHVRFALLSNIMQVGMWDRPLTYPFWMLYDCHCCTLYLHILEKLYFGSKIRKSQGKVLLKSECASTENIGINYHNLGDPHLQVHGNWVFLLKSQGRVNFWVSWKWHAVKFPDSTNFNFPYNCARRPLTLLLWIFLNRGSKFWSSSAFCQLRQHMEVCPIRAPYRN